MSLDPSRDYPLGTSRPDLVRTPGGISLDELELHGEQVTAAELRATPETLRLQATIARDAGRAQLADNLLRAAELAPLPTRRSSRSTRRFARGDRRRRSSKPGLRSSREDAASAVFVREAAQVYAERGLLAG